MSLLHPPLLAARQGELLDSLSKLHLAVGDAPILGCQAGVRALPPRSHLGYVPLAGELSLRLHGPNQGPSSETPPSGIGSQGAGPKSPPSSISPSSESPPSGIGGQGGGPESPPSGVASQSARATQGGGPEGPPSGVASQSARATQGGGPEGPPSGTGGPESLPSGIYGQTVPANPGPRLWLLAGLGSRGLIHHALLGGCVARAVLAQDASLIPEHARRWERKAQEDCEAGCESEAASGIPRGRVGRGVRERVKRSADGSYEGAEGGYV